MEFTYIFENVLVIDSESNEMVRIFHKRKYWHKRRSYLIKLTKNTSLLFPENVFSLSYPDKSLSSHFSKQQKWLWNGPQHYSNFGQTSLHPLLGLWQVSREIWTIFWTKRDSKYLDIKLKVCKRKNKNAEIRLRQNISMGEANFNQFIRQRKKLVVAADIFLRKQILSPVLQSSLSKDMEEQLKLVHKVIDVVDRPNRKICVTLLRHKADNAETSYAQVRLFRWKRKKNFSKLCMSTINLTNLFMFLTSWSQCMMK